jgi:hypothetical protein
VLWVDAGDVELVSGSLCLLSTPEGDRSAYVVVGSGQIVSELAPLPGYQVLASLTDDEARAHEPARTILQHLGSVTQTNCCVQPNGSRVTMLAKDDQAVAGQVADLAQTLKIPVVFRDRTGRIPEVELPQLLEPVTYQGTEATVEEISVFRGEIVLRTDSGTAITVPLANRGSIEQHT